MIKSYQSKFAEDGTTGSQKIPIASIDLTKHIAIEFDRSPPRVHNPTEKVESVDGDGEAALFRSDTTEKSSNSTLDDMITTDVDALRHQLELARLEIRVLREQLE